MRGEQAATLISAANEFNEPPEPGKEYVAIRARVRYIGTEEPDVPQYVSGTVLRITGEQNVIYEWPGVVAPEPVLEAYLFPGGHVEGWTVLSVAAGEQGLVAIFEPMFSFGGADQRFIAIE